MYKHKLMPRSDKDKKRLNSRINIIIGQLNGIRDMINDDRYCKDVIIQISAIDKSIKSLGNELLKSHMNSCIVDRIKNNDEDAVDEVVDLFSKLNK